MYLPTFEERQKQREKLKKIALALLEQCQSKKLTVGETITVLEIAKNEARTIANDFPITL